MSAPPSLKGQVANQPPSFQAVIDQDPVAWSQETPEVKNQVAASFFQKHYSSTPDFQQETPEVQGQIQTAFNQKYGIGQKPQTNFLGDIVNSAINTGSAGAIDLPHGQGLGNTIGSIAGPAIGEVGATAAGAGLAPFTGGASLSLPLLYAGAVGAGTSAREQYNRTGKIDNPLAVATSGITNAALGAIGPVARTAGRPLRMAANAALGGGGNALQDLIQQGAEQHSFLPKIDFNRTKNAALIGAGLGGGMAYKGHVTAEPTVPRAKVRNLPIAMEQSANRQAQQGQAQQFRQALQSKVNEASSFNSVNEQNTLKGHISLIKKQVENLSQIAANHENPQVRKTASAARQNLIGVHNKLVTEHQAKFGKQPKAEKAHVTQSDDFNNLVGMIQKMRSEGRSKEADVLMGQFSRESRAKVYDAVKRNETKEKKQAKTQDSLLGAIESAVKTPEKVGTSHDYHSSGPDEYSKMYQDLKENGSPKGKNKAAEPKADKKSSKAAPTANEPRMTGEAIRAEIKKAEKSGESVTIRYRAEKHGETGQYEYKTVHSPRLDITNAGKVMVRGINHEGQARTYLERDSSGSEIVHVQRDGKPSLFKEELNTETGKKEVKNIETGDTVEQVKKDGKKSSEIRASLDKMEQIVDAVKNGKRPTVSEILDAAKGVENYKSLETEAGKLPQRARAELYEKTTGKPC